MAWLGVVLSLAPVDGVRVPQAYVRAREGVSAVPVSLGHGVFLGKPSSLVSRIGFEWDGPANALPMSWVALASPVPQPHSGSGEEVDPGQGFGADAPSVQTHGRCRRSCSGWGGLTGEGGLLRAAHEGPKTKDEEHGTVARRRETPILETPATIRLVWSLALCPS